MKPQPGCKYRSFTILVDEQTGETLTHYQTKQYILIKTLKNVKYNQNGSWGYIEYTKLYRKDPQQKLPFS